MDLRQDSIESGGRPVAVHWQYIVVSRMERKPHTHVHRGTRIQREGERRTSLTQLPVDPSKTIRLTLAYPASTGKSLTSNTFLQTVSRAFSLTIPGRNFPELLRVVDSLQLGDKHKITTPAVSHVERSKDRKKD